MFLLVSAGCGRSACALADSGLLARCARSLARWQDSAYTHPRLHVVWRMLADQLLHYEKYLADGESART